jgi:hypothetical protein
MGLRGLVTGIVISVHVLGVASLTQLLALCFRGSHKTGMSLYMEDQTITEHQATQNNVDKHRHLDQVTNLGPAGRGAGTVLYWSLIHRNSFV